jgi:PGAP1-like protein
VPHNRAVTPIESRPALARLGRALPTWLHASDVQGLAQLATQGVLGVANLSEAVQGNVYKTVAAAFGPFGRRFIDAAPGGTGVKPLGLTGIVYGSIRGITRLAGGTANAVLHRASPLLRRETSSPQREAMLAALNGVLGDHLLETANPLAITMSLRHSGRTLVLDKLPLAEVFPAPGGKLLVTIHGLCMNDLRWRAPGGASHAGALAGALGYTALDLHYNTGLHTSVNGAQLAQWLQRLVAAWPQPVDEMTLLAHSMGGLVARSACHHAEAQGLSWRRKLKNIVFLGTPHQGAPLEQTGSWVDSVLGSNLFTRPFAAIGQIRSSGITDLRHGAVRESDWQGAGRPDGAPDSREPLALPEGVNCFAVAGRIAAAGRDAAGAAGGPLARLGRAAASHALVGDGLVPLASALGQHADAGRSLGFAPSRQYVAEGVNHMALLDRAAVTARLVSWLSPDGPDGPDQPSDRAGPENPAP